MDPALRRTLHGLVLIVPALLLGLLMGVQLQTQAKRPIATSRYQQPLVEAALQLQAEQAQLKDELAQLRAQLDEFQTSAAAVDGRMAALHAELDRLRQSAGLTELSGAGVTVTLDDGRIPASSPSQSLQLAIVHSSDITDVVNSAWKAGAQGIAVNGERITGSSACVGAVIQINGTLLSPPFVISILGSTDQILRSLNDPAELSDLKRRHDVFGLGLQVRGAEVLALPPYTGAIAIRNATTPP